MIKPLPDLHDAEIDLDTFRIYIDDLSLSEILEVRLKGFEEAQRAGDSLTDLARGATLFEVKTPQVCRLSIDSMSSVVGYVDVGWR
ncbi:MAG: hypothetical protein R3E66_06950 [bacterium]